jgi:hypothetical protein
VSPAKATSASRDDHVLAGAMRAASWGLVATTAEALAASILTQHALAVAALQATAVEWATTRAGVRWTPEGASTSWRALTVRVARGAGYGTLVAAAAVGAELLARSAWLGSGPRSVDVLVVGLAIALLSALRDELLLRGLVLRVARSLLPAWAGIVACAAAGACARLGLDGFVSTALVFEAFRGAALGSLWLRDQGAFVPLGANVAFAWVTSSVARGGLLDLRSAGTAAEGWPAIAVVALAALVAAGAAVRPPMRMRPARE